VKTCNGPYCKYRCLGGGSTGFECNYDGYCDYQCPRDSRGLINDGRT